MAATKPGGVKQKLALATCTLLSQQAAGEAIENDWVFDSGFLTYREADDRVTVEKFIVNVGGNISERDSLKIDVVFDTMTGSTPTGGLENSTIQSVTGTSGTGGFTASGQAAALAPFDDTRLAVKVDWKRELSSTLNMSYGAAISVENDYTSLGASYNLNKETANRLMTYSFGIGFAHDEISQTGGVTPQPLGDANDASTPFFEEGERDTLELLGGITRVINAKTLWQNNLSFTFSDGYHTDPYKIISVANPGEPEQSRLYESRPDSRARTAYYSKLVHQLTDTQTIHFSYRYYTDDWEVDSHTFNYRHRLDIGGKQYIEPNVRLYTQTAADFFSRTLLRNQPLPQYASADGRLDDMTGITLGVKFGKPVGDNGEVRARLAFISQEFDNAVIDSLDAFVLQISFKKGFY